MSCATELLHPANFCPVCGARLAAPPPDGSAATISPADASSPVTIVPDVPADGTNVVYLPSAPPEAVPANPHARDYQTGADVPLHPAAVVPAFGSHGPIPQPGELTPPPTVEDNPFGDFFSDGPSAWLADDEGDGADEDVVIPRPRFLGWTLALASIACLIGGWAVWVRAMVRDAGGADAGTLLLVATLLWIWYLSLPRTQQHRWLLRRHAAMTGFVDRRVAPLRDRTAEQISVRRERDRYRAMGDERARRITSLGEGAYRSFRRGQLPQDLTATAQRVLAIERQMLVQDHRIHGLVIGEHASAGADPAPEPPHPGQPEA